MALDNKYRVHEVAKDFGVSTKEITEILTKYRSAPKNHMQVLDDTDLSVIFEYLTQHNQVSDMEGTLNAQGASRKKPEQSKAETKQQTESKRERSLSCSSSRHRARLSRFTALIPAAPAT